MSANLAIFILRRICELQRYEQDLLIGLSLIMKIIVLGCTRNLGIATIRALASSSNSVIGVDDRPMPLRLSSRFAAKYESYTAETEEEEYDLIERLVRKHEPSALVPGSARFTQLLAPHTEQLSTLTNVLLPDSQSYLQLTDKTWLSETCRKLDIPAPRQLSVQEAIDHLSERQVEATKPTVVIKPREDIGAGRGVRMISRAEEVVPALEEIAEEHGSSFVSEFVPGPAEDMVAVNLLFDRNSQLVDYFAFRKLRLWPPKTGVTALGRSIFAGDLVRRLLPIFESLNWRGPADAEFKIDDTTGEAKLLEINGRFSGALPFSIACGVNFPRLLCDAAMGKNSQSDLSPQYHEGIIYWNPRLFVKCVWSDWRMSGYQWNTIAEALSQASGKKVGTPWRLDDPAPIIGKALIACKDLASIGPSRY